MAAGIQGQGGPNECARAGCCRRVSPRLVSFQVPLMQCANYIQAATLTSSNTPDLLWCKHRRTLELVETERENCSCIISSQRARADTTLAIRTSKTVSTSKRSASEPTSRACGQTPADPDSHRHSDYGLQDHFQHNTATCVDDIVRSHQRYQPATLFSTAAGSERRLTRQRG